MKEVTSKVTAGNILQKGNILYLSNLKYSIRFSQYSKKMTMMCFSRVQRKSNGTEMKYEVKKEENEYSEYQSRTLVHGKTVYMARTDFNELESQWLVSPPLIFNTA